MIAITGAGFVICEHIDECKWKRRVGLKTNTQKNRNSQLGNGNAGFLRQSNEVGYRTHAELFHHPSAVDLDGFFHCSEFSGDLFVQTSGDNVGENFAFARSQGCELDFDGGQFNAGLTSHGIYFLGSDDGVEQRPVVHRLGQEGPSWRARCWECRPCR